MHYVILKYDKGYIWKCWKSQEFLWLTDDTLSGFVYDSFFCCLKYFANYINISLKEQKYLSKNISKRILDLYIYKTQVSIYKLLWKVHNILNWHSSLVLKGMHNCLRIIWGQLKRLNVAYQKFLSDKSPNWYNGSSHGIDKFKQGGVEWLEGRKCICISTNI